MTLSNSITLMVAPELARRNFQSTLMFAEKMHRSRVETLALAVPAHSATRISVRKSLAYA